MPRCLAKVMAQQCACHLLKVHLVVLAIHSLWGTTTGGTGLWWQPPMGSSTGPCTGLCLRWQPPMGSSTGICTGLSIGPWLDVLACMHT